MKQPPLHSHVLALLMPLTMAVLIPAWLLRNYTGTFTPNTINRIVGLAVAVVGLALFVWTLRLFIRIGKGTLAPWNPTKRLVVVGPYKYCRNPMISGVLFVIMGEAIYFESAALIIWSIIFFAVNSIYFIAREEPDLAHKFGQSYTDYALHVGRWLPGIKPHSITAPRWLKVPATAVLVVLTIAFAVVGWLISSKAIAVNPQHVTYDQTVTATAGDSYTASGSAYNITGIVGGIRSDGSMIGILSAPTGLNKTTQTSTRTLSTPTNPAVRVGDKISLQGNIWITDPKTALGLDYQNVIYSSPLGSMKAWLVPGSSPTTWVIGVHGIGASKTEMLRFVEPVHNAGNTMLVIDYRNDPGNPKSPDGHNHLGDTEWQDVQGAVRYAVAHGATNVRLYGDSLGGSLVENYLRRSADVPRAHISKVILDSPALNWSQVLHRQLQKGGYPSFIYYPGVVVLKLRTGVSLSHISTQPANIKQKTLIIHSADDPTVPQNASKVLAAKRPDLVTLVDLKHGGHIRSWNYDRTKYDQFVTDFLLH